MPNLNFSYKIIVWGIGAGFHYEQAPSLPDIAYKAFISSNIHALLGYQSRNKKLRILLEGSKTIRNKLYISTSQRIIGLSVRYLFLNNKNNNNIVLK